MDSTNLFYDSRTVTPELWDASQNKYSSQLSQTQKNSDLQHETFRIPAYPRFSQTWRDVSADALDVPSMYPHSQSMLNDERFGSNSQNIQMRRNESSHPREYSVLSFQDSAYPQKTSTKSKNGTEKYKGVPKAPLFEDVFSKSDDLPDVTLSQLLATQTSHQRGANAFDEGCAQYSPVRSPQFEVLMRSEKMSESQWTGGLSRGEESRSSGLKLLPPDNCSGLTPAPLRIPASKFRSIFEFPYFNLVQSKVFDDVFYTDKSVVVSAPTGSGKTVLCELAIIRLLMMAAEEMYHQSLPKIVYMAPMKSLCHERFLDWEGKFSVLGLKCLELTGDTELNDLSDLQSANVIITTPEKFDSMSRKWKDNSSVFRNIHLFLIDEIHTLNDTNRGATVEAVVSRMKTLNIATKSRSTTVQNLRFIAISATIPNIEDFAEWLSDNPLKATSVSLGEQYRPVPLRRLVIGYPLKEGSSAFRFDLNLSYRLPGIIDAYSEGKPTLVFCSSRKSVAHTAEILAKGYAIPRSRKLPLGNAVSNAASIIKDAKISDLLRQGIGVHHAGMAMADRQSIEELFRGGNLPVLISTSTLAMGVNLPAHLVVIKSTMFYNMGSPEEYSDAQILQMIGRAGRPQFDTSATAIILTKSSLKSKYDALLNGTQLIESSLQKNLIEHLNAEVVLRTITDLAYAVEWIRHTFLYVRVMKNPRHYGMPFGLNKKQVEKRLEDLCLQNINMLAALRLVEMDEDTTAIMPTESGKLMARYCIAFETMKKFHSIVGGEGEREMLDLLAGCAEFSDIQLRTTEKRTLNSLNKDKKKITIKYSMTGKVKTAQMKTNCLIQASLGCLPIHDFSLTQDTNKIFRVGQRVTKCLMEFLWERNMFSELLASIHLYKSFKTRLWCDSKYVAKQLDGIGPSMSLALVNAEMTSFPKIDAANPRELELIVNRHAPFGNYLKAAVRKLPQYDLCIEQAKAHKLDSASLVLRLELANKDALEQPPHSAYSHQSVLLIGDLDNNVIFKWRISDSQLLRQGNWCRFVDVKRAVKGPEIAIHLISLEWVGLDIHTTYEPVYNSVYRKPPPTPRPALLQGNNVAPTATKRCAIVLEEGKTKKMARVVPAATGCSHRCVDKAACGHKCCKVGVMAGGDLSAGSSTDWGNVLPVLSHRLRAKQPQPRQSMPELSPMQQHAPFQALPGSLPAQRVTTQESQTEVPDSQLAPSPVFPVKGKSDHLQKPVQFCSQDQWEDLNVYQKGRETADYMEWEEDFHSDNGWEEPREGSFMSYHCRDGMGNVPLAVSKPYSSTVAAQTKADRFQTWVLPSPIWNPCVEDRKACSVPAPKNQRFPPAESSLSARETWTMQRRTSVDTGVWPNPQVPSSRGSSHTGGSTLGCQAAASEVPRIPDFGSLFEGIF